MPSAVTMVSCMATTWGRPYDIMVLITTFLLRATIPVAPTDVHIAVMHKPPAHPCHVIFPRGRTTALWHPHLPAPSPNPFGL
ncbi:MAG: hypothetical protein UZ06_CHB003001661 [Chlorobi bacterium OLB6]|nr:MAG: hypothetical protein UZ06_CHB003001661 [Chlorobi bacterium OLB6]